MAIERQIKDYELLVRFDGDSVVGAHKRSIEVIQDTDTNEVLSAKELDAQPVELTSGEIDSIKAILNK